jgi:hypothetical protein
LGRRTGAHREDCNLTAQIEPVQDKEKYETFQPHQDNARATEKNSNSIRADFSEDTIKN